MIDVGKVKSAHTRRDAIVYIRQSHPSQVENNRESTARQYALEKKSNCAGLGQEPSAHHRRRSWCLGQGLCQTFRIRSLEC